MIRKGLRAMNIPESAQGPRYVDSVEEGGRILRHGGVLIYPTETFFGIGCPVCDAVAVARVYAAKRRAAGLPLPVLGANREQLARVADFPAGVEDLARRFWPGPLTLLLPALPCVPASITAGTGRIAVRVSSHPVARALALAADSALAASSANISGRAAVTRAQALDAALTAAVDGVLDLEPAPGGGLPSTLARLDADGLHILRVGAVSPAALEAAGYRLHLPV